METRSPETPERRNFAGIIKDYVANLVGTTRSKVEDFSAEVEHRTFRLLWMFIWTAVSFVCLSLALTFAMLTVIFGFDLPPKYAFGIPALVFLAVGSIAALLFLRVRHMRRPRP